MENRGSGWSRAIFYRKIRDNGPRNWHHRGVEGTAMQMTLQELRQGFGLAGKTVLPLQGRIESLTHSGHLEPRTMDLLVYLAGRQGQVVTRDNIIRDVWRGISVTDDVISRSIYLIRKSLNAGREEHNSPSIETIPKRGYRLVAEVSRLPAADLANLKESEAPAAPSPAVAPPAATLPTRGHSAAVKVVLASLLLAVLGGGLSWYLSNAGHEIGKSTSIKVANAVRSPPSILVLPFTSNADGQDPYVTSALTDVVMTGLQSIPNLRIIGGYSAKRIQDNKASYDDIGHQLHVATVLDGSVQRLGKTTSLVTRLIDTRDGHTIQEKTYSVDLGRTSLLQANIKSDLSEIFDLPAGKSAAIVSHEPKPDAYRLLMEGRYYAAKNTPGDYQQAHDYFLQATQVDPDFARAWAELAVSSMLMVDFGNRSRDAASAEATPYVQRALQLEPDSPEALAALGLVALYNHRNDEAAEALRRATALRPGYAQAHMWLGRLFMSERDIQRASAAFERAHDLEPEMPIVNLNLGLALDAEGRYEAAARILEEGIAIAPRLGNLHWALADVQAKLGEQEKAALSYRTAINLKAEYADLYGAYSVLLADMGDPDGALSALTHSDSLEKGNPSVWAARTNLAITTGKYQDFFDRLASSNEEQGDDFWRELAAGKLDLAQGQPARALKVYEATHIEGRLGEHALERETEILGGPSIYLDLACAYQLSGQQAHANALIDRAETAIASDRQRGINPAVYDYLLAAAASMRGDQTRAADLLRLASERGWQRYVLFKIDPRFNGLQNRSAILADLSSRKNKLAVIHDR
jgi:DNA-binding winged helix-turn-helix (wHTH) protein/tetratricopeptide (TPR) repeat protein